MVGFRLGFLGMVTLGNSYCWQLHYALPITPAQIAECCGQPVLLYISSCNLASLSRAPDNHCLTAIPQALCRAANLKIDQVKRKAMRYITVLSMDQSDGGLGPLVQLVHQFLSCKKSIYSSVQQPPRT